MSSPMLFCGLRPTPRGPPHSRCQPAKSCRREGSRRRAALQGAKSAVESATHLPGRCCSGIESSRGPASHTSSGTALSGLLACRRRLWILTPLLQHNSPAQMWPQCEPPRLSPSFPNQWASISCLEMSPQASSARFCRRSFVPPLSLSPQHCPPRDRSILLSGLL
jgi:hypothetical protein